MEGTIGMDGSTGMDQMERTIRTEGIARTAGMSRSRRLIRLARTDAAALFVASTLWLGGPRPAVGQPGGSERQERLTALFSGMSEDTGVRVTTSMLFIEGGSFRGLVDEEVRIEQGGAVVPVPLADIRSVEVERHHPVQGMLWGLGTGLLAGSVSGLLVGSFYCDSATDCTDEERRGALLGGSALGAAGGIVGFVIGKYRVSWRPVFP